MQNDTSPYENTVLASSSQAPVHASAAVSFVRIPAPGESSPIPGSRNTGGPSSPRATGPASNECRYAGPAAALAPLFSSRMRAAARYHSNDVERRSETLMVPTSEANINSARTSGDGLGRMFASLAVMFAE